MLSSEILITNLTFERNVSSMDFLVNIFTCILIECFATKFALKWFLPSVNLKCLSKFPFYVMVLLQISQSNNFS